MTRITKSALDRRAKLLDEQKQLAKKSSTLRDEIKRIESTAATDLESSGKEFIRRGGYTITTEEGRLAVKWKQEFTDRCGVDAVVEVEENATRPKKLVITPPAKQAKK